MAVITQRKNEIQQIEEIIASDTYKDATAMAKAILKSAFESLRNRELYVVVVKVTPTSQALLFGVEGSEAAAAKAAETIGTGGMAYIMRVNPMGEIEARMRESDTMEWEAGIMPCVNCGHHQWEHKPFMTFKGRPVAKQPAKHKCSINCKCSEYIRPEEFSQ